MLELCDCSSMLALGIGKTFVAIGPHAVQLIFPESARLRELIFPLLGKFFPIPFR